MRSPEGLFPKPQRKGTEELNARIKNEGGKMADTSNTKGISEPVVEAANESGQAPEESLQGIDLSMMLSAHEFQELLIQDTHDSTFSAHDMANIQNYVLGVIKALGEQNVELIKLKLKSATQDQSLDIITGLILQLPFTITHADEQTGEIRGDVKFEFDGNIDKPEAIHRLEALISIAMIWKRGGIIEKNPT